MMNEFVMEENEEEEEDDDEEDEDEDEDEEDDESFEIKEEYLKKMGKWSLDKFQECNGMRKDIKV